MDRNDLIALIREKAEAALPVQLELLRRLVSIDCGTGNIEGNAAIVLLVAEALSDVGAQVERVVCPGVGTHIVARLPAKRQPARKIVLIAHLDTVFDRGEAARHPFRIEGDRAFGLGIADCKGGVVVSLAATRIAQELGRIPEDLEIVMIYNCDEEAGSGSSRDVFERETQSAEAVFVFEPGRAKNGIITCRRGCASGWIEISGKAAHAGLHYPDGMDANIQLAHSLLTLSAANRPEKGLYFNAGCLSGGKHADIVSEQARAEFFVSFGDDEEWQWIQQAVKSLETSVSVPGCSVRTGLALSFPAMPRVERNVRIFEKVRSAGLLLGMDLPEECAAGSSDACWCTSFGAPTVDALGPYMESIHTVDECLHLHTIRERTELFAVTLALL